MSIRLERSSHSSEFFDTGVRLVEERPDLFRTTRFLSGGSPLTTWEHFFQHKVSYVTFQEDVEGSSVLSLVWLILDEAVNATERSSFARGGADGEWYASGDRTKMPSGLSVVLSDSFVCFGCGKRHDDPLGWRLEIGPYEVPCCLGRGEFQLKRSCRLEAQDLLSACCLCGKISFDTRGGGRACRDCAKLVDDGEKYRKLSGSKSKIPSSSIKMSRDLREAFLSMLSGMGASSVYGGDFVVPEAASEEVSKFLGMLDSSLESNYQKGLDRGKNLLLGLAEGTVSASEFNATEGASRR